MSSELKHQLANERIWRRGLLIVLFALLYSVAEMVVVMVVVVQFGAHLVTGGPIARLLEFSRGLNLYVFQILQFVTYQSELPPFPLAPWPTDMAEVEKSEVEKSEG